MKEEKSFSSSIGSFVYADSSHMWDYTGILCLILEYVVSCN